MWTLCFTLGIFGVVTGVQFEQLCRGCIRFQGNGFMTYKYCTHYVLCKFYRDGRIDERGSSIQKCPFGEFWSQRDLGCKPAHMVACTTDQCKNIPVVIGSGLKMKPWWVSDDMCSQYWTCNDHKTQSAKCCPLSTGGGLYNPRGNLRGPCVTNLDCVDRCIDPAATTLSPNKTTPNCWHAVAKYKIALN